MSNYGRASGCPENKYCDICGKLTEGIFVGDAEAIVCKGHKIPKAISESEITLGGIKLKVSVLDSGMRVIDGQDVIKFFLYLENGGKFTQEEADILARVIRH